MSKNLDLALHMGAQVTIELPDNPPPSPGFVITSTNNGSSGKVETRWVPGSGGPGGLPVASESNKLLVSGPSPGFLWQEDDLDLGRY